MKSVDKAVFDPDIQEQAATEMSPEQFGVLVARAMQKTPSSNYWALIQRMIGEATGWDGEWDEAQALIDQVAGQTLDGEECDAGVAEP